MENKRKVCMYIAVSLDGYIAKSDGDLKFLSMVEVEGEDYGYAAFMENVDAVILGRKTYDKILSMMPELAYGDREVFVYTHTPRPDLGRIRFFNGDLAGLIKELRSRHGKNIFCDGGAETIGFLLENKLFDELTVSVIPVLLGDGIRLFGKSFPEQKLKLLSSKAFQSGLVQLHYLVSRD
jgi:dihydrofolate reductase